MTALFDRILNFCLVFALLALVYVFACSPEKPASLIVQYLDANMPTSATGVLDPNDSITFTNEDDREIDWVARREPNAPLMTITDGDEAEEVCGITQDWVYFRGRAHKNKSCEEYRAVLTTVADNIGWAHHFFGIAICWLMDPCSKRQP